MSSPVQSPTQSSAATSPSPTSPSKAASLRNGISPLTGLKQAIQVCNITRDTLKKHNALRLLLRIKLTRASRSSAEFLSFARAVCDEFCAVLSAHGVKFVNDLLAVQMLKDKAMVLFDIFIHDYPSMFRENMCKEVNRSVYQVLTTKEGYGVMRRSDLDGIVRKHYEDAGNMIGGARPYFIDMSKAGGLENRGMDGEMGDGMDARAIKFGEAMMHEGEESIEEGQGNEVSSHANGERA